MRQKTTDDLAIRSLDSGEGAKARKKRKGWLTNQTKPLLKGKEQMALFVFPRVRLRELEEFSKLRPLTESENLH